MLVKLIIDKNAESLKINLLAGGIAEVTYKGWGYTRPELMRALNDKIKEQINLLVPKADYYWRGTGNKKEVEMIKTGTIKPSYNQRDNFSEAGFSVSDHLGYVMLAGCPYGYRVKGDVIGYGSDGEPLLDINTLNPIDKTPRTVASIRAKEEKEYFQNLKKAIYSIGWTEEDYISKMEIEEVR